MVLFAMPSRRCRMPTTRGIWSTEAIFEIPICTGEAIVDLVDGNEENYYLNRYSLPRLKSREAGQAGGRGFLYAYLLNTSVNIRQTLTLISDPRC
jgi:hypothetical protein